MSTGSLRSLTRNDIVAVGCFGFMAGLDGAIAAMYFLRGQGEAWLFALAIPFLVAAIVIVARRMLLRVPDQPPQ
jgi:hypothetical protein